MVRWGVLAIRIVSLPSDRPRRPGGRRVACALAGALACAAAGVGGTAHAQTQISQNTAIQRTDEVTRDIETVREVQQLRSIDLARLDDGVDVTFAEVLANPDDIELNVRYALTQIRQGNVRGASATLERVLLIAPNIAEVRILYAVVLFRLDNLDEAEREMRAVLELPLAPDLRRQIDSYLAQIDDRRKTTRFTLSANFSMQFDSNRNSAPRSGERLVFGVPTPLTGNSTRQDDLATNGLVRLGFEHDLGTQARHLMIGSMSYYGGDQVREDDLDLQAFFADWGYRLDFSPVTVTPQLIYKNMRLAREKYLTAYGGSTRVRFALSTTLAGFVAGKVEQQKFHRVPGSLTAPQQSGRNYQMTAGFSQIIDPRHRIQFTAEHTRNSASRTWESYTRDGVELSHTWLVGGGAFLLSSLTTNLDRYDGPDPFISQLTRRDNTIRARFTFGVPLGALSALGDVPEAWSDVTLTTTAEAYRQLSTITNYAYDNYRLSIGLGKSWQF